MASTLGIDLSLVIVGDTSTRSVPNNTCTGGSGTSESSVEAAVLACNQLKSRLQCFVTAAAADAAAADAGAGAESRTAVQNSQK